MTPAFASFDYTTPDRRHTTQIWYPNLPGAWMTRCIRRGRSFYERDLLDHLYKAVPHGGTIVDVGAAFGNHTVFFGKFMADEVLAFEPQPGMASLLVLNCLHNGLTNVRCVSAALADSTATGWMTYGKCRPPPDQLTEKNGNNAVTTMRLDDYLAISPPCRVSLLKIDVQGSEMKVLRGAAETLKQHRPHIAIEAAKGHTEFKAIVSFLEGRYRHIGTFARSPTCHFAPIEE